MCNWKKWIWPGILATVLLTALAMLMRSGAIEQDLQSKALDGLSANHGWAQVALDGRDLTLTGVAPSEEAAAEALQIAEDAYDVRVAKSETTLLPIADPFTLSAVKEEGGRIVLSGSVPSEQVRNGIVEAARASGGGEVDDQLALNRGAPDGFFDLSTFGISQLKGLVSGSASLVNSDLSVEGLAATADDFGSIVSALAGSLPGGGKLASSSITPPAVTPYTLAAETSPEGMVLTGYVPDEDSRSALLEAARAVSDNVTDRLQLASGTPGGMSWLDAGRFAISKAGSLLNGTASLRDAVFSITGMAKDAGAKSAIESDLANALPAGVSLGTSKVDLPIIRPYVWNFENMEGSAPALSGYQPDEAFGVANAEQISASLGTGQPVTNALAIGAGAPRGLAAAASVAIQTASRLINGKAQITGTDLMVTGEALSDQAASEIRTRVENALPPGFIGKHDISVRKVETATALDPDQCQQALVDSLAGNSIRFETAKDIIHEDSYALLDRLSFLVKRCPTVTIEVGGHTDSDGSDDYNQDLSEDRANAVRFYLVHNGVFVGRLKAVGYGETKPIADNATEEGKARNRRIEFTVIR